jgi:hypothetical protein
MGAKIFMKDMIISSEYILDMVDIMENEKYLELPYHLTKKKTKNNIEIVKKINPKKTVFCNFKRIIINQPKRIKNVK